MTIRRLDHVSVVVEDLQAAIAFFQELGMEVEGQMPISGAWADRINGIKDLQVEIAMMRIPDGHGKIEVTKFHHPAAIAPAPHPAPPNTLGLRNLMFAVDDLDEVVARLQARGTQLVGEVVQYEDIYRLCYVRGPEGIIVALAEELAR